MLKDWQIIELSFQVGSIIDVSIGNIVYYNGLFLKTSKQLTNVSPHTMTDKFLTHFCT